MTRATRKVPEGHFHRVRDVEFTDCLEGEILRVLRKGENGEHIGVAVAAEIEDFTDDEIQNITAVVENCLRRMRATLRAQKGVLTQ